MVMVPEAAVLFQDGRHQVFVGGAELPLPVAVVVRGQGDGVRFVEGVPPGAQVAVRGVFLLKALTGGEQP
jgi:hypothetical protein